MLFSTSKVTRKQIRRIPSSSLGASTATARSQEIRYGILQSLQPLHERYPHLIPELLQEEDGNDDGYIRSDIFPPQQQSPHTRNLYNLGGYPVHHRSAYSSLTAAASVAAPSMATASSTASFIKYLLVFTAGGLFFSSAIAIGYAFYGYGVENIRRIISVCLLVLQRVWISFTVGIGTARAALLGQDVEQESTSSAIVTSTENTKQSSSSWKWKKAWNVLKAQLSETRRTAAQGVQALRKEQTLYSALIGQPGLIPLQVIIAKLLPYSVSTIMENSLRDIVKEVKSSNAIKKMTLSSFDAGIVPPILDAARVYDVPNAIAFDYDVEWNSEMSATFQLYTVGGFARIPVSIKSVKFSGVIRVILTPLLPEPPGFGAMLISFPNTPRISLDVKILGGEVTKVPFLRTEITSMLQKSIEEQLVWPRRNVIPTMDRGSIILERSKLLELQKTDPLLVAEQELMNSNQTLVKEVRERVMKETGGGNKNNTISLLDEEEAIDTEAVPTNSTGSWINDGLGKVQGWFHRQQQKREDDSIASPGDVSNTTSSSYLERANGTLAVTSSENNIMAEIGTGFSNAFESVCKFFRQKDSVDNKVEDGNKANGAEGKLAPQS
jgi:hypothetical protein